MCSQSYVPLFDVTYVPDTGEWLSLTYQNAGIVPKWRLAHAMEIAKVYRKQIAS